MKGRKRLPTALKKLNGTYRPDRENGQEPQPESGLPSCPERFKGRVEEKHWHEYGQNLVAMNVMTIADSHALELLCEVRADYDAIREVIGRDGMTLEVDGVLKRHPLHRAETQAVNQLLALLTTFGLTPSSRSRVSIADNTPAKENPFTRFLNKKKTHEQIQS